MIGGRTGGPGASGALARSLAAALAPHSEIAPSGPAGELTRRLAGGFAGAVYAPSRRGGPPGEHEAAAVLAALAAAPVPRVVVLSSTEVYEPHHHNNGYAGEATPPRPGGNPLARRWRAFEEQALGAFAAAPGRLALLRTAPVPLAAGEDFFSRMLTTAVATPLPGFDPSLQLLDAADLAEAVRRALVTPVAGPVNVVPAGVVPVKEALRLAGRPRVPVPRWLQRLARRLPRVAEPPDRADYLRYPWTASGERAARELGFAARRTSAEAVLALRPPGPGRPAEVPSHDDFGMDPAYIAAFGRTLFRLLHDVYWRVEHRGLENVPREGRAVLAGVHRGFMPWDGVMALHLLVRETGRPPRFLLHPTLLKFPFLSDFMTRLGGVPACRENADRILGGDGIVAIFPEGIRGAFTPYRRAYQLGRFGRDEYVRIAVRNRAPIVPFVTVGSAEIYPILGRLHWSWFKRLTEWPCLPLTPTFPWLPVPLPSKWHTRFLAPVPPAADWGPRAAEDPALVAEIGGEVRRRMADAIAGMLARRRSIWRGSIFRDEPVTAAPRKADSIANPEAEAVAPEGRPRV